MVKQNLDTFIYPFLQGNRQNRIPLVSRDIKRVLVDGLVRIGGAALKLREPRW